MRKRLGIIVAEGLGNFLSWVDHVDESLYEIRVFNVRDTEQIYAAVDWCDIVWCEWMNEVARYVTTYRNAIYKDVVVRCHSYEVFESYGAQIDWSVVNALVFVSKNVKGVFTERFTLPKSVLVRHITNPVDFNSIQLQPHGHGKTIGLMGNISHKKGPMLALQVISRLQQIGEDYKLLIAGEIQDMRYKYYLENFIEKAGLVNAVELLGYVTEKDAYYAKLNYMLCTSPWESQNMSVMEGMARGIKPLVHYFPGAEKIYPEHYLWTSVERAATMIHYGDGVEYKPEEVRKEIAGYGMIKVMGKISYLLAEVSGDKRNPKNGNTEAVSA